MTDEKLLFEIRRRVNRSAKKRVSFSSLENSKTLDLGQVRRVVTMAVFDGKLRQVDGDLFEPGPPPAFGQPLPPKKKTKAQLKKEAPLPGQLAFGDDS
jgi:hypothetical protein